MEGACYNDHFFLSTADGERAVKKPRPDGGDENASRDRTATSRPPAAGAAGPPRSAATAAVVVTEREEREVDDYFGRQEDDDDDDGDGGPSAIVSDKQPEYFSVIVVADVRRCSRKGSKRPVRSGTQQAKLHDVTAAYRGSRAFSLRLSRAFFFFFGGGGVTRSRPRHSSRGKA